MRTTLKIRRVGSSLGCIFPHSLLKEMGVQEGDELFLTHTPEGVQLTPYNPDFAAAVEDAREFMSTHRNAFRELAK